MYVKNNPAAKRDPAGESDGQVVDPNCPDLCARYIKDGCDTVEGGGGDLCWGGTMCPCIFPTIFPSRPYFGRFQLKDYIPGACKYIDLCGLIHETNHMKDQQPCQKIGVYRARWKEGVNDVQLECIEVRLQIECLRSYIAAPGVSGDCRRQMLYLIDLEIESAKLRHCYP